MDHWTTTSTVYYKGCFWCNCLGSSVSARPWSTCLKSSWISELKLEYVADLHMHLHQLRLDNLKDLSVWWQKGSIINQTFTLIQYSHKVNLTVLHTSNIWIYSLLLPLHLMVCLRSVRQDVFWNVYLTFIFVLPWAVHYVGQLSGYKFHWQAVATWTSICLETKFCLSS